MLKLAVLLAFVQLLSLIQCSKVNINALMPNVAPKTKDSYLCNQVKLDQSEPVYITNFTPKSTKEVAHHMLLFACDEDMGEEVWNCGEMSEQDENSMYKTGPVCRGRSVIVYAWAMDAPKLDLPKDVAFKLGGNTAKKNLVLQVHYANVDHFLKGETDNSGIVLNGQTDPTPNSAGVHISASGMGVIQPGERTGFDVSCRMTEDLTIYPFAYRTHTHKLGVVNSGYIVRPDEITGEQRWIEIGRRSPQLPQMFFPIMNKTLEIRKDDIIASRCTMKNFRQNEVRIGATGNDEMCNFYIMYYVKGDQELKNGQCVSYGPPMWNFGKDRRLDISKIPENIGQVPANQVKELSEMKNHASMMQMNSNKDQKQKQLPIDHVMEQQKNDNVFENNNINEYDDEQVNDLEDVAAEAQLNEVVADLDDSELDQLQQFIMKKYYNLRN